MIECIEYSTKRCRNTIALIGKNTWLYPKNIDYELPIFLIEVLDEFKWREMIDTAIEIKHGTHMDYLIIETPDHIVWLKSVHWSHSHLYPKNKIN